MRDYLPALVGFIAVFAALFILPNLKRYRRKARKLAGRVRR